MRDMRDEVLEMLRDMNDNDLVAVHNEYCEKSDTMTTGSTTWKN